MAKRLYRSKDERIFLGVCGGVADYFNVDPTVVRLAWIIAGLGWGAGILGYIVAALIVPEEPARTERKSAKAKTTKKDKR